MRHETSRYLFHYNSVMFGRNRSCCIALALFGAITAAPQHFTCAAEPDVRPTQTAPAQPGNSRGEIDAAKLITAEEIRSILGEELKQATPSQHAESGFLISQCYFLLSTPADSAVVTVTSRAPGKSGRSPREFWISKFHGEPEKSDGDEPERKQTPPEPIAGVGDEAFWVQSGSTGALYALQGEKLLRVATGGADEKAARLEKAKKLALLALGRLAIE